jgi:hypothetical protein
MLEGTRIGDSVSSVVADSGGDYERGVVAR